MQQDYKSHRIVKFNSASEKVKIQEAKLQAFIVEAKWHF